ETAGGAEDVDVERDRTTFSVHGTDNQLDYLLAGMRRWIVDGRYDDDIDDVMRGIKRAHTHPEDQAPLTDAWRAAVFGPGHPYVEAGLSRLSNEDLGDDDAIGFRAQHFTPDNATLIVAGHFDPALVDRWVDYLFAGWTGHAIARSGPSPAALRPT